MKGFSPYGSLLGMGKLFEVPKAHRSGWKPNLPRDCGRYDRRLGFQPDLWGIQSCHRHMVFLLALSLIPGLMSADIPEKAITGLQEDLAEASEARSLTRKRLAYKRVVRDGLSLAKDSPDASNRWEVLGLALQGQKQLFALDDSRRNLDALIAICNDLLKAPDEYAERRLEADLLVMERELSAKDADVRERAVALEALIARYRDTPGEAKSLMLASQIAPKLEAFDLEIQILSTMQDRFADHHGVIEFRRKSLSAGRIEALFRGQFKRADGTELSFPVDRLGHPCLMVFWSAKTQGFEAALEQMNAHEEMYPGHFDFYSINLDGLEDWGEGTLRSLGLDWTVMQLPGGRRHQAFRTYGLREPVCILTNAYGYTLLRPTENYRKDKDGKINPYLVEDVRVTPSRYVSQLQSLFIGDFLVAGEDAPEGVPAEIADCFPQAPHRYRLTRAEALANYRKAVKLCTETLQHNLDAQALPWVKNRRLIGLLGMWKMTGEPKYLEEAVADAKAMLASPLPEGADLVARYCIAKSVLRSSRDKARELLTDLVETPATDKALAAATLLAIDANSKELHQHYRKQLLESRTVEPALWPVTTYLRDRFHTLDLMKVKLTRGERRIRSRYGDFVSPRAHAINHSLEPMNRPFQEIELQGVDGKAMSLPGNNPGKLTFLLFVEPPAEPGADFPVITKKNGEPTRDDTIRKVMDYAMEMQTRHIHKEIEVVAAFLGRDATQAKSIMEKNDWPFRTAVVPGGLDNPMVRRLGILSADKIPNVYIIRRDGTIAWHTSGYPYKSDYGYPFAIRLALKVHTEVCDSELAYNELAKGGFESARKIFSGPFLPEKDERYRWRAPRFHGRAVAHFGLGDYEAALADIDEAIAYHQKEWKLPPEKPGNSMVLMQQFRNSLLKKLNRPGEAVELPSTVTEDTYPEYIYDRFHKKLAAIGLE